MVYTCSKALCPSQEWELLGVCYLASFHRLTRDQVEELSMGKSLDRNVSKCVPSSLSIDLFEIFFCSARVSTDKCWVWCRG